MSDYDVQTLLSRATPRRANGDPIENEMTSVNSDVLLAAFDEIERLRARVAELEFRLTPRRPTMPDPVVSPRRAKQAKP
jgi:BMFP domain-containing protein YqiC